MHFSAKCAQRPFEYVCSLVSLYPEEKIKNDIFEMVKQSLEYLIFHLSQPDSLLSMDTLDMFVENIFLVSPLAEYQKKIFSDLIQSSSIQNKVKCLINL